MAALPWVVLILLGLWLMGCFRTAQARDFGQWAQADPGIRDWMRGLSNKNGINCCDTADGTRLDDPDWDAQGDHYRVRLDGEWQIVPEETVLDVPNRAGAAMVWTLFDNGKRKVRCFLPGAGT